MNNIISITRKTLPNSIAQSIVNVQPMSIVVKTPMEIGEKKFPESDIVEYYWVKARISESIFTMRHRSIDMPETNKMITWCVETFGERSKDRWVTANGTYYFKKESDRTLFVLKWSQ